ncbi:MAG: hypothetical protein ACRYFX_15050 [Janthinobacterium lividum]
MPFCEIAHQLNEEVKMASNETHIQDFFHEATLDYAALALLSGRRYVGRGAGHGTGQRSVLLSIWHGHASIYVPVLPLLIH